MEATIKTLATKDDILNMRKQICDGFADIRKEIIEAKADNIKWMLIFWIGQVGATLAIVFLFLKK